MERSLKRRDRKNLQQRLEKTLPAVYFLFVFFLYFSLLSEPYFTDEQDVFYGAYNIVKGRDIYSSFLSQHMPFSYYFAALIALCGARTVFQFRLGTYILLTLVWESTFLRHRRHIHPVSLFAMPLVYLTILKTLYMGTTMISDHWQGIGIVLILLELIRYADKREISTQCAVTVSLGIMLSFGSSFASAYSLFCCFLAMVILQLQDYLKSRKTGSVSNGKRRKYLPENVRLAAICLLPFALLLGWYILSGNFGNFINGSYEIVTQVYSKYTGGLGSDPVSVLWETPRAYGLYLLNMMRGLVHTPWPNLLYLISSVSLIVFAFRMGRKSPAAGILVFLSAVYGGLRGFDGFHGMAYHAQAAAALSLCAGWAIQRCHDRGRLRLVARGLTGAAAAVLLADFLIWTGYNLLYPQILLDRTLRCEEEILDLLTDPEEEIFACNAPVNSLDVMDLELIPKEACGAISYPYFYEMWGDRQMASIQDRPHIVLYNGDESIWGYVFKEYAPDFDAFMKENYTKLPQAEDIWVSNEFQTEALRRLTENGYGNLVVSNETERNTNHPVEYLAGQNVSIRFMAEDENLTAVRFCAACFYRRSRPALTLRIRDTETGELAAEGSMTGERIADNFFSRCPMQGKLTPGKEYELEISVDRIDGKGDMEFYFRPEGELTTAIEYSRDS